MTDVIGTQTRWGVVIAHGFIAGERYVWVEHLAGTLGYGQVPVVSMLPWTLVFPVDIAVDTSDGAPGAAQGQDAGTLEGTQP